MAGLAAAVTFVEAWDSASLQLALELNGDVDLALVDLTMPGMTGFDVLETVRAEGLDSFVIVVSADIQPEARVRVKALGAVAFVEKPISSEKLLPILKDYGLYE